MSYGMQNKVKVTVSHPRVPKSIDWDVASEPKVNHATSRMRPAADKAKVVLSGETTLDNITTECMVDPVRDADFMQRIIAGDVFEDATITYQDIDNSSIPIGKPRRFSKCRAEAVTLPGADANGEDPQKIVIEWAVP